MSIREGTRIQRGALNIDTEDAPRYYQCIVGGSTKLTSDRSSTAIANADNSAKIGPVDAEIIRLAEIVKQ